MIRVPCLFTNLLGCGVARTDGNDVGHGLGQRPGAVGIPEKFQLGDSNSVASWCWIGQHAPHGATEARQHLPSSTTKLVEDRMVRGPDPRLAFPNLHDCRGSLPHSVSGLIETKTLEVKRLRTLLSDPFGAHHTSWVVRKWCHAASNPFRFEVFIEGVGDRILPCVAAGDEITEDGLIAYAVLVKGNASHGPRHLRVSRAHESPCCIFCRRPSVPSAASNASLEAPVLPVVPHPH
mmetsp:Transcript_27358/g.49562  ORF Transcript_27358/g.49562 Transcript_27358/m.49562 type:complete len:235 (-) Transcript_27358:503-1207(-)